MHLFRKFKTSKATGEKDIVVFEDFYRNDVLITSHADIEDKDQTVKIVKEEIPTKTPKNNPKAGSSPKTGDGFSPLLYLLLVLEAASIVAVSVWWKKTSNKMRPKATE